MSSMPDTAINRENGFDKRIIDVNMPNIYFSTEDHGQISNSDNIVMSERVQRIASAIYREFEAMIEAYGLPVVERLMPLIIGLLENLDELYKDQTAYRAEVSHLREENDQLFEQLNIEKSQRKLSEMRLLQVEDTLEDERKAVETKNEQMASSYRQLELKFQLAKDQVSRFELKEKDTTQETNRLHERINELVRSNLELTKQLKLQNRLSTIENNNNQNNNKINANNNQLNNDDIMTDNSFNQTTAAGESSHHSYDANSTGFGFDEMPTTDDPENMANFDDDLPAGMRKEIDVLIRENMDLLETKNALNVVKDDLLGKIDHLTSENASYKESVNQLSLIKSNLQAELASSDQFLNEARSELNQLRSQMDNMNSESKNDLENGSHRKRFTRSEMARILAERNHYKERLLELQDAVRLTETLRVGEKAILELLPDYPYNQIDDTSNSIKTTESITTISNASTTTMTAAAATTTNTGGPLQSLQRFFSAFSSGPRSEQDSDTNPNAIKFKYGDNHQSWITLSRTNTTAPVYGWSLGLEPKNTGTTILTSSTTTIETVLQNQSHIVPIPVQCRTIGGLHRSHLEICTTLIVPCCMENQISNKEAGYHLWLIGRSAGDADASPTHSRSYVGQVHIFEPSRFTQPICSFDLDHAFLPISAVYVKNCGDTAESDLLNDLTDESLSKDALILHWDRSETSKKKSNSDCNSTHGYVILASNDGRFLVYKPTGERPFKFTPQLFCLFRIQTPSLIAHNMIAIDGHVCFGLSNPVGVNQLVTFHWSKFESSYLNSEVNEFKLKLLHLPNSDAPNTDVTATATATAAAAAVTNNSNQSIIPAGPLVVCLNTQQASEQVWLGTAGGGYCHSINLKTGLFTSSLKLPIENPCLHAIELQNNNNQTTSPQLIWLALSGNQFINAKLNNSSNTNSNNSEVDELATTTTTTNEEAISLSTCTNSVWNSSSSSGGMARILVFCPKRLQILRLFDMTTALCNMFDMEGVTDPIDLTICRLLTLTSVKQQEIWFATRSGLIARLDLNQLMIFGDKQQADKADCVLVPSSMITLSCHGYRRPVCNLLQVKGKQSANDSQLLVSIGHDYVDLRSIQLQLITQSIEEIASGDEQQPQGSFYMRRSHQKGSGAHAIVWRLDKE